MVEIGYVRDSVPVQKKQRRLKKDLKDQLKEEVSLNLQRPFPASSQEKNRNKAIELLFFSSLIRKITSFNWGHKDNATAH